MKVKVLQSEAEYDAALALIVEEYESKHYPVPPPDPIEAIKFRSEQMGLSETELNNILGGRQRKYEILHKKRKSSLAMIGKLSQHLRIPAETLIRDYKLEKLA